MHFGLRLLAKLSGIEGGAPEQQASPATPQSVPPAAATAKYLYKPNQPLAWLSRQDAFTVQDAFAGVHVFGSNGSGKSSGSGRCIASAYLSAGWGGLVIAAKPGDRKFWQDLARETGREDHLFIIAPDQPWRFNVIAYDLNRAGSLSERIDNVMATFDDVLQQAGQSFGGESQQWINAAKDLMKRGVAILAAAYDSFSYGDIIDFIAEAPDSVEKVSAADFAATRFAKPLARAEERNTQTFHWADFARMQNYWLRDYPRLPVNTRESARFVLNHLHSNLETGRTRDLFGTDSTIFPEDTHAGAIILVDLPTSDSANIPAQILFKIVWQGAVLRRGSARINRLRPVFLVSDESHLIVSPNDTRYQSLCREAGGCTLYLTQNISSYQQRLPGPDSKATTAALLGYFQTQIFHAQADRETIEHAQRLFDKDIIKLRGESIADSRGHSQSSGQNEGGRARDDKHGRQGGQGRERSRSQTQSFQEQLHESVTIRQLTTLKTGGPSHGYRVGAYVFTTGRKWRRSKATYLYTEFSQR